MRFLVSCPFGLSALLAKEIKRLCATTKHFSFLQTLDTAVALEGNLEILYRLNLWSRIANKVYVMVGEGKITTFDQLFQFMVDLPWAEYLPPTAQLSLQVITKNSQLFSERTIQSVAHKAILTSLASHIVHKQRELPMTEFTIFLHLQEDFLNIYLNTSGASLHQRGRRKHTGPAPLKENLAAAMVLLSGWKFKAPLRDPFCGSGTLLIEAAMLAKNLAPGMHRRFAFQSFTTFDVSLWANLLQQAQQATFSHPYQLVGYDYDQQVLSYAKENAERAGVAEHISRAPQKFSSTSLPFSEDFWLLTNPPYGKRLAMGEDIGPLYQQIATLLKSCHGGIISSYPELSTLFPVSHFSHKSLYNGADKVEFYWKKL